MVEVPDSANKLPKLRFLQSAYRFAQISFYENKAQYQQTRLGLVWIPLSTLLFVLVLVGVFSTSQNMGVIDHFLYILSGYCLWLFILEVINQSTSILQGQIDFANHNRMSIPELFLKNLFDRLFRHLLNIAVLYGAMLALAFSGHVSWASFALSFLLYPMVLVISAVTGFGLSFLVNVVCLFWPDLEKVIHTSTRFLFFLSPVFWIYRPGEGGFRYLLITFNPVTYWLDIIRQAIGVAPLDLSAWTTCLLISSAVCATAYLAYHRTLNLIRNIS